MSDFSISGQLIDLHQRRIYPAVIRVSGGIIAQVSEAAEAPRQYILPGFVDAHVHIESSMLAPAQFARMAVVHGTVATVSDPHEIANVCGVPGVQWMVDNAKTVPFKCFFGAPSCVPATSFETAGAVLDAAAVDALLASPDIWYLAEMMNYPGVLHGDPEIMAKIAAARKHGKPVDGHAPGLTGNDVRKYASAGISTDHECTRLEEALDKIEAGMHILIREGSAAKNFEALHSLLHTHPGCVMFCSDDKHPDDLALGHINQLVQRALAKGYDLFDVLRSACLNPVMHYRVPVGLLRVGDPADFIVVRDMESWQPLQTFVNGILVAEEGLCSFEAGETGIINHFKAHSRIPQDFTIKLPERPAQLRVIAAHDGQLVTSEEIIPFYGDADALSGQDILKLSVINRYEANAVPAIAFIRGFGLRSGAIASTVAHDCHNIIAVGADDASICTAVNAVIKAGGGIAVAGSADDVQVLPLPVAGLISTDDGYEVGRRYAALSQAAKDLGSGLHAPFMTLSFMALLVIPVLKLSDKGLFDGGRFVFTDIIAAGA
jgi:adenine deaminase